MRDFTSKWHLYRAFYKSTVAVSYGFSVMFSFIISFMFRDMLPEDIITGGFFRIFVYAFAWSNMTAGPLMAFGYKEITNSGEYYFYYNRAISKIQLFAYCFIMNILLGIAIFTVQSYVASA